jgi:hypothetical protein
MDSTGQCLGTAVLLRQQFAQECSQQCQPQYPGLALLTSESYLTIAACHSIRDGGGSTIGCVRGDFSRHRTPSRHYGGGNGGHRWHRPSLGFGRRKRTKLEQRVPKR